MNNKFDELAKSMAQSVTRRGALKKFGVGLAGMALACFGLANKARAGTYQGYCEALQIGPQWGQGPHWGLTGVCLAVVSPGVCTRGTGGCPAGRVGTSGKLGSCGHWSLKYACSV